MKKAKSKLTQTVAKPTPGIRGVKLELPKENKAVPAGSMQMKLNPDDAKTIKRIYEQIRELSSLYTELQIKSDSIKKNYLEMKEKLNVFLQEIPPKYNLGTDKFEVNIEKEQITIKPE